MTTLHFFFLYTLSFPDRVTSSKHHFFPFSLLKLDSQGFWGTWVLKSTCNFPKIAFFENFQKHLKISLKAITQFAIPEKFVTSYSNVTDSREHNNCYPFFHSRSWCPSIFIFSSAWNIIFDPIIYSLLEKNVNPSSFHLFITPNFGQISFSRRKKIVASSIFVFSGISVSHSH